MPDQEAQPRSAARIHRRRTAASPRRLRRRRETASGTGRRTRASAIAHTTPPLAVPSSLVRIRPVSPSASSKALTWLSAFWPVLASSTSHISCGAPGSALAMTRLILLSFLHEVPLRRQASCRVGDHHVGAARARGRDGVEHHRPWIAARLSDDRDPVPLAPRGKLIACRRAKRVARGEQHGATLVRKYCASLPAEVVFPAPLTPASRMTLGFCVGQDRAAARAARAARRASRAAPTSALRPVLAPLARSRSRASRTRVASTPASLASSAVSMSSYSAPSIAAVAEQARRAASASWRARA